MGIALLCLVLIGVSVDGIQHYKTEKTAQAAEQPPVATEALPAEIPVQPVTTEQLQSLQINRK